VFAQLRVLDVDEVVDEQRQVFEPCAQGRQAEGRWVRRPPRAVSAWHSSFALARSHSPGTAGPHRSLTRKRRGVAALRLPTLCKGDVSRWRKKRSVTQGVGSVSFTHTAPKNRRRKRHPLVPQPVTPPLHNVESRGERGQEKPPPETFATPGLVGTGKLPGPTRSAAKSPESDLFSGMTSVYATSFPSLDLQHLAPCT
jgi:hypothetical protein